MDFILYEASSNHNGSFNTAKKLILEAKKCGAHAIKFQTYKTNNFVKKENQFFETSGKKNKLNQYQMFKKYEFTSKQWRGLQNYAKEIDINFFTTPGSLNDLSHFNLNDFPFIKIGSDDFVNKLLLTEIIKMKLPILISRGMSSKKEVNEMVSFFKKKLRVNCLKERVSIMHCVSLYPSPHESINIDLLNFYKRKYNQMHWGYSDHSLGDLAILVAASNNINILKAFLP